ncbi:hypothetical protein SAMN04489729_6927 [Amycolatopsis lurida]|nr:hypothetical protein SAMN04489729_6927 [Amycolatopsis lurida]
MRKDQVQVDVQGKGSPGRVPGHLLIPSTHLLKDQRLVKSSTVPVCGLARQ